MGKSPCFTACAESHAALRAVHCMQGHHMACIVGSTSQSVVARSHDTAFLTTQRHVCMDKQKHAQCLNIHMDGLASLFVPGVLMQRW
jgi:hypothetical protein